MYFVLSLLAGSVYADLIAVGKYLKDDGIEVAVGKRYQASERRNPVSTENGMQHRFLGAIYFEQGACGRKSTHSDSWPGLEREKLG